MNKLLVFPNTVLGTTEYSNAVCVRYTFQSLISFCVNTKNDVAMLRPERVWQDITNTRGDSFA